MGPGRKHKLPGSKAPSKRQRFCAAEGCGETFRGCDLAKHYRTRTDFIVTVIFACYARLFLTPLEG